MMPDQQLMTVSQFAKLVGTTRRTLIFYDQKGIFKPIKTKNNGYRYYDYSQIYQINLILGLRELGLTVEEIKDYQDDNSSTSLNKKLNELKQKVKKRINNLQQVLNILDRKEANNVQLTNVNFYEPQKCYFPLREFWCSDLEVNCSEQEIAKSYSNFYQELGTGTMANNMPSGFLTDLPKAQANKYVNASFRIIKEKSHNGQASVPVISQPQGEYVVVKVKNTGDGIEKGLTVIRNYIDEQQLEITGGLWQFNLGIGVKQLGLTENSILAYQIV